MPLTLGLRVSLLLHNIIAQPKIATGPIEADSQSMIDSASIISGL